MKIAQACDYICVGERSMRRRLARRDIPYFKIGGGIRIDRADLDAYLNRSRVRPR